MNCFYINCLEEIDITIDSDLQSMIVLKEMKVDFRKQFLVSFPI